MRFTVGDRVAVPGIGGRYQRQTVTPAIVTRVDTYRDSYTVRFFHLYERRFTSNRVAADRVLAVEEMPFLRGDGAWEDIEADLDNRS